MDATYPVGGEPATAQPHRAFCEAFLPHSSATIDALLSNAALSYPMNEAVVVDGARFTFAEIDRRAAQLAEALHRRGIARGAVIGTMLSDGIATVELLIAAAKLGATILALNWRASAAEVAFIGRDADPDLCFVSEKFKELVATMPPKCAVIRVKDNSAEGAWGALGLRPESAGLTRQDAAPDDRWYMLYTSGTTGQPKGCQHSQGAYYCNILAMSAALQTRSDDRFLLTSPLFHVGGLSNFLARYVSGSATIIPRRGLSAEELLQLVSDEAITAMVLPYVDAEAFIEAQRKGARPLHLRMVMAGAAQRDIELLTAVRDVLKTDLKLGYGQSEIGGFASFISFDDQVRRPNSCGRPILGLAARIVDAAGEDAPIGATGELLLRGPSIMMGYLNLPHETDAAIGSGWLKTGDLFYRDAEGFLFFAGRVKELIKSGGENIYPLEVEKVLLQHADICDACIVGVPDQRWGEAVKAFVVLAAGKALKPADVADWCRGHVAGYKRPRYVEFVASIPRNAQGKPDRAQLSAQAVEPSQATDPI